MRLASWLAGRHELSALGKQWGVAFTYGALLQIEELTGIDLFETGLRFNASMPARVLRAVLYAVLQDAGCPLSLADAGNLLHLTAIGAIRGELLAAWNDSMPLPSERPASSDDASPMTWFSTWASGRQDLGLSEQEWLAMTPRMLQGLDIARLEQRREFELIIARLTAEMINHSACRPEKPKLPREFMLHPWPKSPDRPVTNVDVDRALGRFVKGKPKK